MLTLNNLRVWRWTIRYFLLIINIVFFLAKIVKSRSENIFIIKKDVVMDNNHTRRIQDCKCIEYPARNNKQNFSCDKRIHNTHSKNKSKNCFSGEAYMKTQTIQVSPTEEKSLQHRSQHKRLY
jgi:hypothetical protein